MRQFVIMLLAGLCMSPAVSQGACCGRAHMFAGVGLLRWRLLRPGSSMRNFAPGPAPVFATPRGLRRRLTGPWHLIPAMAGATCDPAVYRADAKSEEPPPLVALIETAATGGGRLIPLRDGDPGSQRSPPTFFRRSRVMSKPSIRWMIRRDMPEVLEIEQLSFDYPWLAGDFSGYLRNRNVIGLVCERPSK